MADQSNDANLLLWVSSNPMLSILIAGLVVAGIPVALVIYLDQRIAIREAERTEQVRPADEPSGAVPSRLPRKIVRGQTVYVPLYSHVFEAEGRRLPLACTLSIRNTDPKRSLTIAAVKYYDTRGKLVRDFLETPLKLNPLGSTDFLVKQSDMSGGAGANFIVEWVADEPVYEPVIEAVMVGRGGTGMTSFVRSGRVLEQIDRP